MRLIGLLLANFLLAVPPFSVGPKTTPLPLTASDTISPLVRSGTYLAPAPMIMPGVRLDTSISALPPQRLSVSKAAPAWLKARTGGNPMYIIDGKPAGEQQLRRLRPDEVASVNVLDGQKASLLYGHNARRGLVMITTKAGLLPHQ